VVYIRKASAPSIGETSTPRMAAIAGERMATLFSPETRPAPPGGTARRYVELALGSESGQRRVLPVQTSSARSVRVPPAAWSARIRVGEVASSSRGRRGAVNDTVPPGQRAVALPVRGSITSSCRFCRPSGRILAGFEDQDARGPRIAIDETREEQDSEVIVPTSVESTPSSGEVAA